MLEHPLTLDRIREEQTQLRTIRGKGKYFPFELKSRPARPMEGYLFKLPFAFVELFPELQEVPRFEVIPAGAGEANETHPPPPEAQAGRRKFVPKNEDVRSKEAATSRQVVCDAEYAILA